MNQDFSIITLVLHAGLVLQLVMARHVDRKTTMLSPAGHGVLKIGNYE